jgi:transcriptional regulator with XRE-family HTH domain
MLSRIENGSANPSLETVCYLAERLHVSPGFLLAEEQDECLYARRHEIDSMKAAMRAGNYSIARDICEHSENRTEDEFLLILAECELALAKEAFRDGRLHECAELLDRAVSAGEECMYRTECIRAEATVYFGYMQRFSPTLCSGVLDEDEENFYPALSDDFCRYAVGLAQREADRKDLIPLADSFSEDSPLFLHLSARDAMRKEDYQAAGEYLRQILGGDHPIERPVLYDVFCDLEICCRECEDFKGAYEYANNRPILLQQLLS